MIFTLQVVVVIVVVIAFLLTAYKTTKGVSPVKAFLFFIVELVVFAGIGYGGQWAVAQSFIKVQLTKFRNTPLPSSEKLAVKGCVKNVGSYKATIVTLHIKVINNASGGSLSKSGDSRPQSIEYDLAVAKNLAKGTTKCFNKSFPYPPYFKLANIKAHVSAK